jgi:hypothetical protein
MAGDVRIPAPDRRPAPRRPPRPQRLGRREPLAAPAARRPDPPDPSASPPARPRQALLGLRAHRPAHLAPTVGVEKSGRATTLGGAPRCRACSRDRVCSSPSSARRSPVAATPAPSTSSCASSSPPRRARPTSARARARDRLFWAVGRVCRRDRRARVGRGGRSASSRPTLRAWSSGARTSSRSAPAGSCGATGGTAAGPDVVLHLAAGEHDEPGDVETRLRYVIGTSAQRVAGVRKRTDSRTASASVARR